MKTELKPEIDFLFSDQGTIILMMPKTELAKEFVENYIEIDTWQSKDNIAIEP